ncbi:TlpA disulfide reductase family protein [Luteococcus peritonei]|uniref:TlpA family protein disulfide reductase n=1 Tax=Luteococcus peritonei TaxID=88874 RepID=A0ABW4RUN3_9ACTN
MNRRTRLAALAAVLTLAAACTPAAEQPTVPQYTVGGDETQAPSLAPDEILPARTAAGIPACPRTASGAKAVAGGLPALELDCLGGDSTVNLAGLQRGTPWVVNLWAQWCQPCNDEAPLVAQAAKDYRGKINFLGIDYDDPFPHKAIAFADKYQLGFAQVVDPEQTTRVPARVRAVPQTYFVDAGGRIVHIEVKPLKSSEQFDALVAEHLGVQK